MDRDTKVYMSVAAIRAGDEERARHHLLTSLRGVEAIIAEMSHDL